MVREVFQQFSNQFSSIFRINFVNFITKIQIDTFRGSPVQRIGKGLPLRTNNQILVSFEK